jgi:hypothetical protein
MEGQADFTLIPMAHLFCIILVPAIFYIYFFERLKAKFLVLIIFLGTSIFLSVIFDCIYLFIVILANLPTLLPDIPNTILLLLFLSFCFYKIMKSKIFILESKE